MTTPTTPPTAQDLLARWDAQQTAYIRHRAERFNTIARVVTALCADTPAPRVLDLAGGPGSLAQAVLAHIPEARTIVVDKDPVLLKIAAHDHRLEVAHLDLDDANWASHAAIAGHHFDAIISSTALHWLRPETLVSVYWKLADLLRPGGIFLNGDHFAYDDRTEPTLRALAAEDDAHVQQQAFAAGVDTWDQWWAAAESVPDHADAVEHRRRTWGPELHTAPPKVTAEFHLQTLRSAGFTETGTVWRYLDDHVLYAVR